MLLNINDYVLRGIWKLSHLKFIATFIVIKTKLYPE